MCISVDPRSLRSLEVYQQFLQIRVCRFEPQHWPVKYLLKPFYRFVLIRKYCYVFLQSKFERDDVGASKVCVEVCKLHVHGLHWWIAVRIGLHKRRQICMFWWYFLVARLTDCRIMCPWMPSVYGSIYCIQWWLCTLIPSSPLRR